MGSHWSGASGRRLGHLLERLEVCAQPPHARVPEPLVVDAKGSTATTVTNNYHDLFTKGNPFVFDESGGFFSTIGSPSALSSGSPPYRSSIDESANVARFFCKSRGWCGRDSSFNRYFYNLEFGGISHYRSDQERIYLGRDRRGDFQTIAHEHGHLMDIFSRDDYINTFEGREVQEALGEMFAFDTRV